MENHLANDDLALKEDILNLIAWSDPASMGLSLIAAIMNKKQDDLQNILNENIASGSLIDISKRYRFKSDLLEKRQAQFPISNKKAWVINVCRRMGDWFEARRKDSEAMAEFEAELPLLPKWLAHVKPYSLYHASRLTWLQAYPLYYEGKFADALQSVQTAVSNLDEAQTPESEAEDFFKLKVNLFQDIAAIQDELGNTGEAFKYYQYARETLEQHLTNLKAEKAEIISNIGGIHDRTGNRDEALKHFEQALEIRQQLFGDLHPDTAASFNNIGTSYYEAKKYSEAIQYLQKAVETRKQLLGDEHPDTNDSLYNLAVCLVNLKKLKEAYEWVHRQIKKLSPSHPNYAELAGLLQYIDSESVKSGFRPISAVSMGKKGKKKKKKR